MHSNTSRGRDNNATRVLFYLCNLRYRPRATGDSTLFLLCSHSWIRIRQRERSTAHKQRGDPGGNMAYVHPILHLQIRLHRSSPGHFHLNGQSLWWWTFWGGGDRRHEWISVVSPLSLTSANLKDTCDESHQSASPHPQPLNPPTVTNKSSAQFLFFLTESWLTPNMCQFDTGAACVCNAICCVSKHESSRLPESKAESTMSVKCSCYVWSYIKISGALTENSMGKTGTLNLDERRHSVCGSVGYDTWSISAADIQSYLSAGVLHRAPQGFSSLYL